MSAPALCPNFFLLFFHENGKAYSLLFSPALLSRIRFCAADSSLQKSVNRGGGFAPEVQIQV